MPRWIEDIQGIRTILDENGDPVQRRAAFQVLGATVSDNGTHTVIEVPAGPTGPTGPSPFGWVLISVTPGGGSAEGGVYIASDFPTITSSTTHVAFSILADGLVEIAGLPGSDGQHLLISKEQNGTTRRIGFPHFSSLELTSQNRIAIPGEAGTLILADRLEVLHLINTAPTASGGRFWVRSNGSVGFSNFAARASGDTIVHDGLEWLPKTGGDFGRLLRAPQVLTGGTSITHPAGTRLIKVRGVGGGGAGGGRSAAAGSGGSPGGSGTYGERTFTANSPTSTYTIGAGGAGSSGAAGGAGGASTFTHGATTLTLPGGLGGGFLAGGTSVAAADESGAAADATNADFSIAGQSGGRLVRLTSGSTQAFHNGPGGSNPLGQGAFPEFAFSNGASGTGYGSGGGGDIADNQTNASVGTAGQPGVWIVEEYS
jgi:hypothetical protein